MAWYTMIKQTLYRIAPDGSPLQLCLSSEEGALILESTYVGSGGAHLKGCALALQITQQGYFWPTFRKEAKDIAHICLEFQQHQNIQRQPLMTMTLHHHVVPFARWGLDIVESFPLASRGRKYLLVAVKYSTKWAKAKAVRNINKESIKQFIFRNIICCFGVLL